MTGSLLYLDAYLLIFQHLDGRDLARWMQMCRALCDCIKARPELCLRVQMRVSWCNTIKEIMRVIALSPPSSIIPVNRVKDEICRISRVESFRFLHADGIRAIKSTNGEYIYLITDSYDSETAFLNMGMHLEKHYPASFRVMGTILFNRCTGFCLFDYKNHTFDYRGDCCDAGIHRGYCCVIRFTTAASAAIAEQPRLEKQARIDVEQLFDFRSFLLLNKWKCAMERNN